MEAVKIAHVKQEDDKGCVIACIAMILGWKYGEVARHFHNDFNKSGTNTNFARDFVCEHGYSVIEKRGTGYMDVREHNQRMIQPFAPVHIVSVQQFVDLPKRAHAFVMTDKREIFDPADKDHKQVDYYMVRHIMGFFDDHMKLRKQ